MLIKEAHIKEVLAGAAYMWVKGHLGKVSLTRQALLLQIFFGRREGWGEGTIFKNNAVLN